MSALKPKKIIISRTDSIGDVVLTLPICSALKKEFPDCPIVFLGAAYTMPILKCCPDIDELLDWTEIKTLPTVEKLQIFQEVQADCIVHVFPNKEIASLAKKAKIKFRIGTSHRPYHLLSCNVPVSFTRKKSELHESVLNFNLIRPFGFQIPSIEAVQGMLNFQAPRTDIASSIQFDPSKTNFILHPKSQGSAVEWPIDKYVTLARELNKKGVRVYVTGTEKEGKSFKNAFPWSDELINTAGCFSLTELIAFIDQSDGLLACSTGPLHIAGALNKTAIGLFSPKRPIHPGRWEALGKNSIAVTSREECPCKKKACNCINEIAVAQVLDQINQIIEA